MVNKKTSELLCCSLDGARFALLIKHFARSMNPNEDEELDRILAGADFIETDDEPRLLPELVGVVVTPTGDVSSTQEKVLREGRVRETHAARG